jgi:hypothetical protein
MNLSWNSKMLSGNLAVKRQIQKVTKERIPDQILTKKSRKK